jgi:ABC transporter substrate binding protein
VPEDGLFQANAGRLAELSNRHRLLAYAVDFPHIWRQGAVLVDKILKGAKPADLPIQQATRFELVINLKTARARADDPAGAAGPGRRDDRRVRANRRAGGADAPGAEESSARAGA